jgi:hypothetical protein
LAVMRIDGPSGMVRFLLARTMQTMCRGRPVPKRFRVCSKPGTNFLTFLSNYVIFGAQLNTLTHQEGRRERPDEAPATRCDLINRVMVLIPTVFV